MKLVITTYFLRVCGNYVQNAYYQCHVIRTMSKWQQLNNTQFSTTQQVKKKKKKVTAILKRHFFLLSERKSKPIFTHLLPIFAHEYGLFLGADVWDGDKSH